MATNKNQHYVPRCYLRPFSVKSSKVAINLFNIDRKKFIKSAPLKHQCSKDYFYGKDMQLEKAIKSMEDNYAEVLKEVLQPGYCLLRSHGLFLLRFWLLQYLRTDAASKRALEVNEEMGELIGENAHIFKMCIREAVQHAMNFFANSMDIMDDLKICLIKNRTSIPFFSSDDPAVLTNLWYMVDKRAKGTSFGLNAAGNLLLLPMSPKILCLGYDGSVYSVPNSKGWVEIKGESDIHAFNQHQFLNCCANIYVHEAQHEHTVQCAFSKIEKRRPCMRHRINYAVLDKEEADYKRFCVVDSDKIGNHQDVLMHMQTIHGKPIRWPKQICWKRKGVVYTNHTGLGFVRRITAESGRYEGIQKELAR